jgi:hypothetical protein
MYCIIFDSDKKYIGLYEYFTTQHVENFIINNPGAAHFFLMNTPPAEGIYEMSEDNSYVERGHIEVIDNSVYVERVFWWEKYTDPESVPSGMETEFSENLLWIYNGGTEATVPNPMPETQVVSYDIVRNWVVDEAIIPDETYSAIPPRPHP